VGLSPQGSSRANGLHYAELEERNLKSGAEAYTGLRIRQMHSRGRTEVAHDPWREGA